MYPAARSHLSRRKNPVILRIDAWHANETPLLSFVSPNAERAPQLFPVLCPVAKF